LGLILILSWNVGIRLLLAILRGGVIIVWWIGARGWWGVVTRWWWGVGTRWWWWVGTRHRLRVLI